MTQERPPSRDYPTEGPRQSLEVESATSRVLAGAQGIRILCVDDDTVNLQLRGEILRRQGYQVALDSSPVQALDRDLLTFDLAILDYEMPGLNGVELLLAMRARHVACPIILLSGQLASLDAVQQSLFYGCIEKGQAVDTLLQAIDSYVRSSKLSDQTDVGAPKYRGWMLR